MKLDWSQAAVDDRYDIWYYYYLNAGVEKANQMDRLIERGAKRAQENPFTAFRHGSDWAAQISIAPSTRLIFYHGGDQILILAIIHAAFVSVAAERHREQAKPR